MVLFGTGRISDGLKWAGCSGCEMAGHNLIELENQDIVLPVVNLNVRYKSSARLNDNLIIETSVSKFNGLSVTFHQTIKSEESLKTFY